MVDPKDTRGSRIDVDTERQKGYFEGVPWAKLKSNNKGSEGPKGKRVCGVEGRANEGLVVYAVGIWVLISAGELGEEVRRRGGSTGRECSKEDWNRGFVKRGRREV